MMRYSHDVAKTRIKTEMGPVGSTVAEQVRLHRERVGMSFAELSRQLLKEGRIIPPLGLSRIEAGLRRVDADDLVSLAVALGVSPISLLLPAGTDQDAEVQITATNTAKAKRVWSWLSASYPLGGSVLQFYSDALPPWERVAVEDALGAANPGPSGTRTHP
jgi:transcriptional regulator with XRE-family HTH domain